MKREYSIEFYFVSLHGWSDSEEDCRLTIRDKLPPDCPSCNRRSDVGFRLVKSW